MAVIKQKHFANLEVCDTYWKRFKGLMFRRKLNYNDGLLFILPKESRIESSIHMLFVFFPIDALWLDNNFKVVHIKRNLMPFSLNVTPDKPARYVLEAAAGKFNSIKLGDKFEISGLA